MALTTISWCSRHLADGRAILGYTANLWRGCTKVSDGCKFCYAESMSGRNPKVLGIWGKKGTRAIAAESYWKTLRKYHNEAKSDGERRFVFCASLADVFEGRETMPEDAWEPVERQRVRLFRFIKETPFFCWLLLTKRPQNIKAMLPDDWGAGWDNVWLGTSVEHQDAADQRIQALIDVPAKRRFLSCEPLLGPVRFKDSWLGEDAIGWCIAGGESGSHARPMELEWVRSMRDQCARAGVAFYMKQFGTVWAKAHSESGKADSIADPAWPIDLKIQQQPSPY